MVSIVCDRTLYTDKNAVILPDQCVYSSLHLLTCHVVNAIYVYMPVCVCVCVCVCVDGRSVGVQYSHWSCGLPYDQPAGDCILVSQNNYWITANCSIRQRYVCQSQWQLYLLTHILAVLL